MPEGDSTKEQYVQRPYGYSDSRRRFIVLFFLTMLVVFAFVCLSYFGHPVQSILLRYDQILGAEVEGMQKMPDLQARLAKLENQLTLLTTESVDARLTKIEQSIHAGRIRPGDVASLNDLKNEVQQLKTYMFRDPRELVELKELQTNYQKLMEAQATNVTKETLQLELSHINTTNNILWAAISILFTGIVGLFFGARRASRKEDVPTTPMGRPEATIAPPSTTNG